MFKGNWLLIYVVVILAIVVTHSYAQNTNNQPPSQPPSPAGQPPSPAAPAAPAPAPHEQQPVKENEKKDDGLGNKEKNPLPPNEQPADMTLPPTSPQGKDQQPENNNEEKKDMEPLPIKDQRIVIPPPSNNHQHVENPNNATAISVEIPLPENLAFNEFNENNNVTDTRIVASETNKTENVVNPQQINSESINQTDNNNSSANNPSQSLPNEATTINADLFSPSLTSAAVNSLPTSCHTQGQIAVTYSEGPSDATAQIVKQLNNADAHASFFVNATWLYMQQYATVVENTYKAGHLIGMTYRVKNDDASSLTDRELRDDIISNARAIEALIKVAPKYVRLHYSAKADTRTEAIIRDLGFVLVGYNLDSQDYALKDPTGPQSIGELYKSTLKHQKDTYDSLGSFISIQYDIPDTGALAAVPFMVNTIQDNGYLMVRLDGCLNDPKPYKKSADSLDYVSDKFSYKQEGYRQGQKSVAIDPFIIDTAKSNNNDKSKNTSFANINSKIEWLFSGTLTFLTFFAGYYVL